MSHEILVGVRHEEGTGQNVSVWYEGVPVNSTQLVIELEALAIPNVRTYSVFGRPGECAGVYAWSTTSASSEYHHTDLTAEDQQRVIDTIRAHTPLP